MMKVEGSSIASGRGEAEDAIEELEEGFRIHVVPLQTSDRRFRWMIDEGGTQRGNFEYCSLTKSFPLLRGVDLVLPSDPPSFVCMRLPRILHQLPLQHCPSILTKLVSTLFSESNFPPSRFDLFAHSRGAPHTLPDLRRLPAGSTRFARIWNKFQRETDQAWFLLLSRVSKLFRGEPNGG